MKKNAKRFRSLDRAQLAQGAGGASMEELRNQYQPGSGWYEFFDAAGGCEPSTYLCFPG